MENPSHVKELEQKFGQAVELHKKGDVESAIPLYSAILQQIPDSPLVNYNLALAFYEMQNYQLSVKYYSKALETNPDNIDILYNLALAQFKNHEYDKAITHLRNLLQRKPEDVDARYNLAKCLTEKGEINVAVEEYRCILEFDETHPSALNNLAFLLHRNECFDEAAAAYESLMKVDPENSAAQYMIEALSNETPETAPAQYIEQVFDNYATRYDESLVQELGYSAPNRMREVYLNNLIREEAKPEALDLGCGTGLSGDAFRDLCSSITGVDLSEKMIAKAREKNIYSSLYTGAIEKYLQQCDQIFNLVLAADVFTYIGDLQPLFKGVSEVAASSTTFIFTTELHDGDNYTLKKTGRYGHAPAYINEMAILTGWRLHLKETIRLRKEKDTWISGMLYVLRWDQG